uniref:Uncharacterized protein n=1 Tax=Avena sativa TaxID=4498 RepID=A0ACD5XGB0_AVESA
MPAGEGWLLRGIGIFLLSPHLLLIPLSASEARFSLVFRPSEAAELGSSQMEDGQSVVRRHGVAAEEDPARHSAPSPVHEKAADVDEAGDEKKAPRRSRRVASLDVFRGLTVALMILVDGAGGEWPVIGHAPWNGCNLADFVMPSFLFIVGMAIPLSLKRIPDRGRAVRRVV